MCDVLVAARDELEWLAAQRPLLDVDVVAIETGQRLLACVGSPAMASVARTEAAKLYSILRSDSRFDRLTYWDSVPESVEVAYCCAALLLQHAESTERSRRAADTAAILARRPLLAARLAPSAEWFDRQCLDIWEQPRELGDALAKAWPSARWTSLDALLPHAHRFVPVERDGRQALVALGDLVAAPSSYYLAQHRLFDQIPSLRRHFGLICLGGADQPTVCAWIGANAHTPVHADPLHNVVVQLLGTKRWRLWPPDALPHSQEPTFQLDLAPGTALFVPRLWQHDVRTLDDQPTLAVSFWSSLFAR